MRPLPPEVGEDVRVVAAGLLHGIRQHREPPIVQQAGGEETVVVGGVCERLLVSYFGSAWGP